MNVPCETSIRKVLRSYLSAHPFHHSLWRTFEAKELSRVEFRRPVLDIGCSEGFFTSKFFKEPICNGIDISKKRVIIAREAGGHQTLIVGDASALPYRRDIFDTVFSISVIEHIFDIRELLKEVSRVLCPSGKFIITVPSHLFPDYLFLSSFLRNMGFLRLASLYGRKANEHLGHHHCYSPKIWQTLLGAAGMNIIRCKLIVPYKALQFMDRNYFLSYLQYLLVFLLPDKIPLKQKIGLLLHNVEGIPDIFVLKNRKQSSIFYQRLLKYLEIESNCGAGLLIVAEKPKK